LGHAERGESEHRAPRVVGENARVPRGPACRKLRTVKEKCDDKRRGDGADDVGDGIGLRQVLTDERTDREVLRECHESKTAPREPDRLPPLSARVERGTEVVLMNLIRIETPPMVLVLGRSLPVACAEVRVVAAEASALCRRSSAGYEIRNPRLGE
jgi:hypothetical protein